MLSKFSRRLLVKGVITKGTLLSWQGKIVTYEASLSLNAVQIYDRVSKTYQSVDLADVELLDQEVHHTPELRRDSEYNSEQHDEEMLLASSRFEVIKDFLATGKPIKDEVESLSLRLGVSHSYCYRLVQMYDGTEGPISLFRFKRGMKAGTTKLPPKIEAIIDGAIKTGWHGPGARVAKIYESVCEACRNAGEAIPARASVAKRIRSVDQYELATLKVGKKAASDVFEPRPGKVEAGRPNEKWQMDHTVLDCIVVDEKNRRPLGRPWVTLIIDVYSRIVMGFYLSWHAPNSLSVAMAISHAVLPKKEWLSLLSADDIRYPFFGKPESILMDNAKEFRSKAFRSACALHNINPTWRRKRTPHWGGHIERLNGSLQMGYVHYLPGTTLSNVEVKGDYNSEKEAVLTFAELRLWFTRAIEIYHKKTHRMIGTSAQQRWSDYYTDKNGVLSHPALIKNPTDFFIDFLPRDTRVVNPKGILMNGIFYYSSSLKPFVGRSAKLTVKYNPQSLRRIWVEVESRRYTEVPYADRARPDISLGEYKAARKQIATTEKERVSSSDVFQQIEKNRVLVEDSKIRTKHARKLVEQVKQQKEDPFFRLREGLLQSPSAEDLDYDLPVKPSESHE